MHLYLTTVFLSAGLCLGAQSDFHRYYDAGGSENFADLVVLSPNRLVAIGSSTPTGGPPRAVLYVLDVAGNPLRSFSPDFPRRTLGRRLAVQTDSTVWVGCWRTPTETSADDWVVYLVNVNTGAATGFGWGNPTADEQIRAMTPTPDGGVIVAGNTGGSNRAIVSRITAGGTELWRRNFSIAGNRYTVFTGVVLAENGDVVLGGLFDPDEGGEGKVGLLFCRLTGQGELVRSMRYDLPGEQTVVSPGPSLAALPDGEYGMFSSIKVSEEWNGTVLLRTDGNGALLTVNSWESIGIIAARDLLLTHPDTLRLVGGFGACEDSIRPYLIDYILPEERGNDVIEIPVQAANTVSVAGVAARPGSGYYLYGRGNDCTAEGQESTTDAVLLTHRYGAGPTSVRTATASTTASGPFRIRVTAASSVTSTSRFMTAGAVSSFPATITFPAGTVGSERNRPIRATTCTPSATSTVCGRWNRRADLIYYAKPHKG